MVNNLEQNNSGPIMRMESIKKEDFVPDIRYYALMRKHKDNPDVMVDVMGAVNDLEPWLKLSYLDEGYSLEENDKSWFVGASIPLNKFPEVIKMPFVKHLEIAPTLRLL